MKRILFFFFSLLPIPFWGQEPIGDNSYIITEEFANNINKLNGLPENFHEGLARVRQKDKSGSGLFGYIDKMGRLVIPYQFDDALDFSEGLALVYKDGKGGYIDYTGKIVIPFEYDEYASSFSEGFAVVHSETNYKFGYINKTGKLVIPYQYDFAYDFREGFARVAKENNSTEETLHGFINKKGNVVIPIRYFNAGNYHEGLVYVIRAEDWNIEVLDKTNKNAFTFDFDHIIISRGGECNLYFSEGLSCVEKNGKYGYIDKTGKVVVPFLFSEGGHFSEGLARVGNDEKKYGFIDTTGTVVIQFQFEEAPMELLFYESGLSVAHTDFCEGLARVCKDGKFGFIDQKGNIIIPIQYDYAQSFQEGLARVWKDGEMGYVDKFGNCTISHQIK